MLPYIISISIIVSGVIFYLRYKFKIATRNKLKKITEAWGNSKKEYFPFDLIGKYAALFNNKHSHELSEQTLFDIDFYALFSFVDRTTSKIGQQYLFKKMIHVDNNLNDLQRLDEKVNFLRSNSALREEIQKDLLALENNDAYYIVSLLKDKLLERPKWFSFLIINILTVVTILIMSIKYSSLLIVLIIPVTLNMIIHYWNKKNIYHFTKSFPQLNILIEVCKSISKRDIHFADQSVDKSVSDLKPFQIELRLLSLFNEGGFKDDLNQIVSYFIELIKAIFLIEVFTLFHVARKLETKKASIQCLFNYVGHIDTCLSIASLRAGSVKTCKPEFISPKKELAAKSIYHPLIENCVKNDISIRSKSILITGSNMSGKTTFLRTIILNSILAQTIYTCFADEFKLPLLKQYSSIRIDDNLLEGKSYYFEEVNVMASLIKVAESDNQNIFALDEVFKGTNTVERIASAKAILSYLNQKNNIVIVATHDIELSNMLKQEYDLYHFTETIQNDALHFDHKIKAGQLKTRNAIKILELASYPKVITDEAQAISSLLDSSRSTLR